MITIKLFALLKEKAGRDELQIAAGPATIAELLLVDREGAPCPFQPAFTGTGHGRTEP